MFKTISLIAILAAAVLSTGCASYTHYTPEQRLALKADKCKRNPYCGSYSPKDNTEAENDEALSEVRERVAAAHAAEN